MDKNLKVELNEMWWKENQPRTLTDKGKIGPALKKFETNWKLSINAKGPTRFGLLEGELDALAAIDTAAGKTAGACKKGVHDDAKHVLTKSFPKKTTEFRNAIKKELDALDKKFNSMNFNTVFKDKNLFNHFAVFAKNNFFGENTMFLIEGKKPSDKLYQKYIPDNAPFQINIKHKARVWLNATYEKKKVKDGPSDTAYKEIYILTKTNFNNRRQEFVKYLMKQKVAF